MALTVVGTGGCVGVESGAVSLSFGSEAERYFGGRGAGSKKQFNLKAAPDLLISRWANFGTGVNGIPSQAWNPDGADHNGSYCIKPPHRTPSRARGQRRRPLARAARIGATTMAISSDASGAALATPAAETLQVRRQLGRAPAR